MEINRALRGGQARSVKYFQIRIPNYFTERSGVYFNSISILFRLPAAAGISLYYFTERARRGGYLYRISYLVLRIFTK